MSYDFWHQALAGKNPEVTLGEPGEGFYKSRRRISTPNEDPKRQPGDPRRKVRTVFEPVAIWKQDDGWHCTIHREDGTVAHLTDLSRIEEQIFAYVCRAPLTHEEYQEMVNERHGPPTNYDDLGPDGGEGLLSRAG
jgi:hypothetical protein